MEFKPFKDLNGDFLHLGYLESSIYAPQFNNTISIEIEMIACDYSPCLCFNAEQLRDLAKMLVEAADFLDKQGA
jgi:hypothetical protein